MSNQKKFGVWMDSQHATVAGREHIDSGDFVILSHVKRAETHEAHGEKNEHNQEKMLQGKFFNEITTHMQNAEEVHVTGTGVAQEQFMHFLAGTPQFKNTKTTESTSNKMSDESLLEYFEKN